MICAKCGEPRAHRSHRSGPADWIEGLRGKRPYRCRACNSRFYVFRDGETSGLRNAEERRILKLRREQKWRRSKLLLALFSICIMLMAGLIYFLTEQKVPTINP